jgi:hypothetical protein
MACARHRSNFGAQQDVQFIIDLLRMGNDRWRLVHALRQAARTQARKGGSKNGNAIHWLMNLLLPLHYLNLRKTADSLEEMGLPRIGRGQSDVLYY